MSESGRLLLVGGQRLYVLELGPPTRHPLLIVHGGPDWDHRYLLPVARILATDRRVILFDLRGCGGSSACPDVSGYTRDAAVRDILGLIPKITPSRVHLLGFSFGGRLALRAAQRAPDRLASLILASTSVRGVVRWDTESEERSQRAKLVPRLQDVLGASGLEPAEKTRRLAIESLPLDVWSLEALPRVRQHVASVQFSGEWGKAWAAGLLAPEDCDDAEFLRTSNLPTLILHGRQDFRFPASDLERLRGARSTLRIEILEDAGHLAHLERIEAWCDVVRSFLDNVDVVSS